MTLKKEDLPFITKRELYEKCQAGKHTLDWNPHRQGVARVPYDSPNIFRKGTTLDFYYLTVLVSKCVGCDRTFEIEEPKIVREYKEEVYRKNP